MAANVKDCHFGSLKCCLSSGPGAGPAVSPTTAGDPRPRVPLSRGCRVDAGGCENLCNRLGEEPAPRRAPDPSSPRRSLPVSAPPLQPMALSEVAACGGADPAPGLGEEEAAAGSALRSLPVPAPRLRALLLPAAASRTPPAPSRPSVLLPRRFRQHGLGLRGAQRRRAGLARR